MAEKKFQVPGSEFQVGTAKFQNYLLNKWGLGTFLLLIFVIFATPALAHRVLVFAYAEGDTIHTESKFVPNTPVRQGEVQVLDQKSGKVLVTGKTDAKGKFSFKIPAAAVAERMDLKIVTGAAMGHQGEWLLKAASYLPGAITAASAAAAPAPASTPAPAAPGGKPAAVEQHMLEEVVNKALERQLGPIREQLAEMAVHRTSLPDIIGGLGYILGFIGLWAYFQSKRKNGP